MLSQKRLKELLDYDPQTGFFTWRSSRGGVRAGDRAGCVNAMGYRVIRIDRRMYREGRLAFLWMTGRFPLVCDHIDRNRENSRWQNLRDVDHAESGWNRSTPNGSSRGVCWNKANSRWLAFIGWRGEQIYLGSFKEKLHAMQMRRCAELLLWGEFAEEALTDG